MADTSFADMLLPGEIVTAQVAGEGRTIERGHGLERTWWQVGLTRDRLLVVRMKQAAGTDRWDVIARLAGPRANVRVAHFPRTAEDTARLTIDGTGDPIVFIDVDRPPVQEQVRAFLQAWGKPVMGGDTVGQAEVDVYNTDATGQKTFIYIAVAMLVMFVLCCGCLGIGGVLRTVFAMFFAPY
ncbi:MAG: hypothetical protein Q8P18_13655 [Pseudomonadota bacterium]|nr:hypothetical protein [Pseudomonadota bacterium]